MTLKVADRVRENTTTVGSGVINLVGNTDGFRRFTNVLSNGDTTYYCIEENNKFEVRIGTYNSDTLTRDYILQSSQNGNKINLGGSGVIFITYPADKAVIKDQESHVLIGQSGIKYYDGTIQKTAPASLNESIYISGIASYGSGLSITNENNILYLSGLVVNAEESLDISYVSGVANYASGKSIANKTLIDTNIQDIVYISGISAYSSGQSLINQSNINLINNNIAYISGIAVLAEESSEINYVSGISIYSSGQSVSNQLSINNLSNDIVYVSGLAILAEESQDISYISGIAVYTSGKIYNDTYLSGIAVYVSGQNIINQSNISNLNSGLVYVSGLAILAEESLDISYLSGIAIYSSGQSLTNQQSITQNTNDIIYISGLAIAAEESSDLIYVSGIAAYASGNITSGGIDLYTSGIATYASGQSVQNKLDIIATSGWSNATFLKETSAPFIYLSGLAVSAEESLDINYVSGIALYVSGNALYNIVEDTSPQLGGNLDTNNYYISGVGNIIGGTGLFSSVKINNIDVSVSGHSHIANDITNFNTAVSGLIPVKNILASTGISVSNLNGNYTISSNVTDVIRSQSIVTTVFNKTGSQIPKANVVYINGGQGDLPTIQLAIANGEVGSSKTYGITYDSINNMGSGRVVVLGALSTVNTDQFNPSAPTGDVNGVTLWLSPTTSGAMTTSKPYAPNHAVAVGTVVRTHQNEGIIEVKIQNGYELEELHNVAITGVTNGQFLIYNSGTSLWVPTSSGNFTTLQVNNVAVPTGVGATNYVAKWNNANTLSSGTIYDNGTNLGIGTTSPNAKLDVRGSFIANDDAGDNDFRVEGTSDPHLLFLDANENTVNIGTGVSMGPKLYVTASNSTTYNSILPSGSAGSQPSFIRISNLSQTNNGFAGVFMSATRGDANVAQTAFISAVSDNSTNYQPHIVFVARTGIASFGEIMRINNSSNVGIGTSLPSEKLHVSGNSRTDGNLSFSSFTESVTSNGNSGTSKTLDLTNGTVHTSTLTGNCTFTMPLAVAGKSFTLFLNTGAGGFSASFTGVRWASSTPPTITTTASKVDILSFISDGTYWYGSYSQNYG